MYLKKNFKNSQHLFFLSFLTKKKVFIRVIITERKMLVCRWWCCYIVIVKSSKCGGGGVGTGEIQTWARRPEREEARIRHPTAKKKVNTHRCADLSTHKTHTWPGWQNTYTLLSRNNTTHRQTRISFICGIFLPTSVNIMSRLPRKRVQAKGR